MLNKVVYLNSIKPMKHSTLLALLLSSTTLTTQARACLTAALYPAPTRPLDGQEPLIEET